MTGKATKYRSMGTGQRKAKPSVCDTEIKLGTGADHRVTFRTGKTVCVESLIDGCWVGRWWSADGKVKPSQFWISPAFDFQIKLAPAANDPMFSLDSGWQWVSAKELPKTERGARHVVVELIRPEPRDQAVTARIHTLLDGTPVLTRWLEIANDAPNAIAVLSAWPWTGKLWAEDAPVRLGYWAGRNWAWECWFDWKRLKRGENVVRNDSDITYDDPNFLLRNESNEEYFFGQMEWATNYEMAFDKRRDGLSFRVGPIGHWPLRVLTEKETVHTPRVHVGCARGSFDAAVQAMHAHLRKSVILKPPAAKAYRSQYLCPGDWEVCPYHDEAFNEENMIKVADVAAAAGLEAFLLDGPTWCAGYGRWLETHPARFPRGVDRLREYVHSKGMLFGMYFETEGGRDGNFQPGVAGSMDAWRNSPVYREHPEWFVRINLDLTIPEAARYFEEELCRIIEHYKLDLYRHDENSVVFCPPGAGGVPAKRAWFAEGSHWRHYEALYKAFQNVHKRFPKVILQQASAGGYRLDIGTARHLHEHFSSDCGGDVRRFPGISVFLPPECVVNAMGMPPHIPFELHTRLRAAYALGCMPQIFNAMLPGKLADFTPEDQAVYRHYAELYRTFIRPLMDQTLIYHHEPVNERGGVGSGDWTVMEFVAPDRSRGWATAIRMPCDAATYRFQPRGLDAKRSYRVTFDNSGEKQVRKGAELMREGLEIRTSPERHSELLLFEAVASRDRGRD